MTQNGHSSMVINQHRPWQGSIETPGSKINKIATFIFRLQCSGGNLEGRYYLQQFHFHWDGNDRFGSEHTLDGLHYPLEVSNEISRSSFSGSLTTPPCSENVIWTILVQPNYVSEEQVGDGSLLIDNWRKTQPMNGRTLYLNKKKPYVLCIET
ncbi:unnamed protein product [Haemonchus placei]|uniref:carbonic anhydrase n=1 Tax=Haemonchus placei TaxID=6290 RepID=A0A3P7VVL5_HAEPC|nr:unnamed protein product [Haemonchus placei]